MRAFAVATIAPCPGRFPGAGVLERQPNTGLFRRDPRARVGRAIVEADQATMSAQAVCQWNMRDTPDHARDAIQPQHLPNAIKPVRHLSAAGSGEASQALKRRSGAASSSHGITGPAVAGHVEDRA